MNVAALRAFLVKEVRHLLRDRQTLTILLLLPLVQVVLFGFALRSDVRNIRIAFVDATPGQASTALRHRFAATNRFEVVGTAATTNALAPLFRRGAADLAIVFEHSFGERIARGEPATVQLVLDASDPNTATTMQSYVRAVIAAQNAEWGSARGALQLRPQTRMRFNPTLESVNLFVPGLIALVLTLVSALMTAISLSREKERGTFQVLLVSPLRPWHIIVGKVLPYLGLAFANVATALLAARLVFGVPLRGSLTLLLAASMLFSIISLGIGVLVAAKTSTQRSAMLAALLGTMLPSTLLSGMIFPIASMPVWLQPLTHIVPAKWFIVVARGIMLKGVGMVYVWRELLIMLVMMLVVLLVATRSVKARLA